MRADTVYRLKGGSEMKHAISRLIATVAILVFSSLTVLSQSDATRTTLAITYPLDQTIEVPFHGTTRLPRLKGSATVRRQGRRGTRVTLRTVLASLADGDSLEQILKSFPTLSDEQVRATVAFAAAPERRDARP